MYYQETSVDKKARRGQAKRSDQAMPPGQTEISREIHKNLIKKWITF